MLIIACGARSRQQASKIGKSLLISELDELDATPFPESDGDLSDEAVNNETHNSDSEQDGSETEAVPDEQQLMGKDMITVWRTDPVAKQTKTKTKHIVRIQSGPRKDIVSHSEMDSFLTQFSMEIVDEIVCCTNLYITQKVDRYTRMRDVKETTREEYLALLGILFLIGTKKGSHTNVRELWATDGSGMPILRAAMSYKRFLFLLSYTRFDDPKTRIERRKQDKLAAIRSIFDKFVENFKKTYSCTEDVTIDEMLHSFSGRCSWIQYIPSKPAKYGIKFFAMCDANTYFTNNIEVYVGKQPNGPYEASNSPRDIVDRLTAPIYGSWRTLTTDNWYTSIPLAKSMFEKKITLLGTLRKNKREIPPCFQPNKSKPTGKTQFGYRPDMTLLSYTTKPNKSVILLSTTHDFGDIDVETKKPQMILDYNHTKCGVDVVDQLCATYSVARVTNRWPMVIFYSMVNISGNFKMRMMKI